MIDLRFLGTLEIRLPDGSVPVVPVTQPKRLAVLLYLALAEPSGPQSRESLMALLWPEADAESARHSLRNALYGLRQALGDGLFIARGEGYIGLDLAGVGVDALEVRRLLVEGKWGEAVANCGGELTPGFHVSGAVEFDQWLEVQRTTLRRAVNEAAWRWVDELEKRVDSRVASAARRAWALDPANESGARRLIRILDSEVGRVAALRAYDDLADFLRREYEADPSPETRALGDQLKARSGSDVLPGAARVAVNAPATAPAEPELASSGSIPPRRRPRWTGAALGAAVLLAMGSVFALRPTAPMRERADSTRMTTAEGSLLLPERYRRDTALYASYLRALTLRFHGQDVASHDSFAALVDRAPLYAPAYSGLAHAYIYAISNGRTPPAEGYPLAEAAAQKALALDSSLASAYVAEGMIEMIWRWDVAKAGKMIDLAVELEPSDPEVHLLRANWFRWQEEADSSLAEARKTLALDPLNPGHNDRVARMLFYARRYAEAESVYRKSIRDYPAYDEPYRELADLYREMGRMRAAVQILRAGAKATADSGFQDGLPPEPSESEAAGLFTNWARQEIQDLRADKRAGKYAPADQFVMAFAVLRDTTETLRWLDSAVIQHNPKIQGLLVNPRLDFLRADARFLEWKAHLPWRVPPQP